MLEPRGAYVTEDNMVASLDSLPIGGWASGSWFDRQNDWDRSSHWVMGRRQPFCSSLCCSRLINGIKFDDALSRSVMPQRRNALCTEGWRKPSRNTVTKMPLSQIFGQLWKRDRHYERPGELGLHESGYRLAIANRTTMPGPAFVLSFKTSDIRPTFLSCRSALKNTKTYCSLCLKIIWSSIDTWKYPMLYDTLSSKGVHKPGKDCWERLSCVFQIKEENKSYRNANHLLKWLSRSKDSSVSLLAFCVMMTSWNREEALVVGRGSVGHGDGTCRGSKLFFLVKHAA